MSSRLFALITLLALVSHVEAATTRGDVAAGRDLVMRSCIACHAVNGTARTADGAPPLSYIVRDIKERPEWIKGWLMDPHDPMPNIMLSRQQIADITAYLNSLSDRPTVDAR